MPLPLQYARPISRRQRHTPIEKTKLLLAGIAMLAVGLFFLAAAAPFFMHRWQLDELIPGLIFSAISALLIGYAIFLIRDGIDA